MNGVRSPAIRSVCPFRLVVDDDLEQLDREVAMIDAEAGSTLFEEGDAADGVASIVEGTVEILKRGRVLATLGPGTVVGELSMFVPSATRSATARASTPVRMINTALARSGSTLHEEGCPFSSGTDDTALVDF